MVIGTEPLENSHSGQKTQAGKDQERKADRCANEGCDLNAFGMIGHGVKLARRPNDAGNGENDEVYPARASIEAMAQGNEKGEEGTWNIDDEFDNGDSITGVESHCATSLIANEGKQSRIHWSRTVETGGVSRYECLLDGQSTRFLVVYI